MTILTVNRNTRLEPVKLSMAETIFLTINRDREYLKEWLPFVDMTQELSDTEKFLQSIVNQQGKKNDEIFSIWYNDEFAGLIGLKDTDWINKKTEIGYWLAEKMQGKGIIYLCAKKIIEYSFKKLKLNRIQIKVALGNKKSQAIPKRLGFYYEGIEKAGEFHQKKYLDLQVFSLLKKDWLL